MNWPCPPEHTGNNRSSPRANKFQLHLSECSRATPRKQFRNTITTGRVRGSTSPITPFLLIQAFPGWLGWRRFCDFAARFGIFEGKCKYRGEVSAKKTEDAYAARLRAHTPSAAIRKVRPCIRACLYSVFKLSIGKLRRHPGPPKSMNTSLTYDRSRLPLTTCTRRLISPFNLTQGPHC